MTEGLDSISALRVLGLGMDSEASAGVRAVDDKPFSLKWGWPGITFSLTRRVLVVSRKRGDQAIHLTVGFANKSGEIDLHLKREPPGPGEDPYISLARIAPERLTRFGEKFNAITEKAMLAMLAHWKPVRPGWLEREGYYLFLVDKDPPKEVLDRFREFFPKGKRRKYLVSAERLNDPKLWENFADHVFPASVLRYVEPNEVQLPMQATSRIKGKPRLTIGSFNIGEQLVWCMLSQHRLTEMCDKIMADIFSLIGPSIDASHGETVQKIIDELWLTELPELIEPLSEFQSFLAAPQATIEKAQRRARGWTAPKNAALSPIGRRLKMLQKG